MTDLEQRIKEAAAKVPQQWFIQEDGAISTLAETREYAALASPANILALLAEKDAEIERLARERGEFKGIAERYQRNHHSQAMRTWRICGCDICKAYALVRGE